MATELHNLSHSPSRLDGIIRETNRNGLKHLWILKTNGKRGKVRNCINGRWEDRREKLTPPSCRTVYQPLLDSRSQLAWCWCHCNATSSWLQGHREWRCSDHYLVFPYGELQKIVCIQLWARCYQEEGIFPCYNWSVHRFWYVPVYLYRSWNGSRLRSKS